MTTLTWNSLSLKIIPVHSKGDQSWVFIGRTDSKAEIPILWPLHAKCWLIGKDSDVGRDWGQEEKGTTEDKVAEWHHGLSGRESEWTLGDGDGQGGLACCDSWGPKESDTTERLSWTEDATHCWLYTQQSFPVKLPYSCCLLTPTIPSHSSKVTVSPTYPSIFLKNPFLFDFEMPAAFVVSGFSLLQWSFWLKSFWLKSGFFFFFDSFVWPGVGSGLDFPYGTLSFLAR